MLGGMGVTYQYANLTKREWFSASAFGGSGNSRGLGTNLTARAFELLLVRPYRRHAEAADAIEVGRWADDSIAIVGDDDAKWLEYFEQFADLYADLIPLINHRDGFEGLGEAAAKDDRLYAQICHLIVTRQAMELEGGMKARFGTNFRQRYKEVLPRLRPSQLPKDLRPTAGG